MNKTQRYLSAWSRHHRSGGFGIHSPHAYEFVRTVLRGRLPYYAYDDIGKLIDAVKSCTTAPQRRATGLIGNRAARLLFRVTNYVTPRRIFQAGAASGVESVVMLSVNSECRLWLYDPCLDANPVAGRVLGDCLNRIACYDDEAVAGEDFLAASGEPAMALLNMPIGEAVAFGLLDAHAVVVLNQMHRNKAMVGLYDACCGYMTAGQTFTNGKTAILIPNPKLQREDFELWL